MSKSLAEKYKERPQGTLQQRARTISEELGTKDGALVDKAAELARHAAQLSIEMMPLGLVTNFDSAVPKAGAASQRARELAPVFTIEPDKAKAKKLT
jgi:hypothetical protein